MCKKGAWDWCDIVSANSTNKNIIFTMNKFTRWRERKREKDGGRILENIKKK